MHITWIHINLNHLSLLNVQRKQKRLQHSLAVLHTEANKMIFGRFEKKELQIFA